MRFKAGGASYSVDVVKRRYMTYLTGSGWEKFTTDKNLRGGSVVVFNTTERPWKANIGIFSEGIFETNTGLVIVEEHEEMFVEGDGSDEEDDDGVVIEYTKGANLNPEEVDKLNAMVQAFKMEWSGTPIVHRLTPTNIASANMKIPRRVAVTLGIPKQGMFGVRLDNSGKTTLVSYSTCTDGRIALFKQVWSKFVASSSLEADKQIIMYFKTTSRAQLNLLLIVRKI